MNRTELLKQQLAQRILVTDGATGSLLQTYQLDEAGYRMERFADFPYDIKGNHEVLNLTQPDIIKAVHTAYLEAGADLITTNTFNGTAVSQAEYHMEHLVYEMNYHAARLAREAIAAFNPPSEIRNPKSAIAYLRAYASTLLLTLSNPVTILSFTAVFAGFGLGSQSDGAGSGGQLVLGVFLGSALWWLILCGGVTAVRARLSATALRLINIASGLILIGFSVALVGGLLVG